MSERLPEAPKSNSNKPRRLAAAAALSLTAFGVAGCGLFSSDSSPKPPAGMVGPSTLAKNMCDKLTSNKADIELFGLDGKNSSESSFCIPLNIPKRAISSNVANINIVNSIGEGDSFVRVFRTNANSKAEFYHKYDGIDEIKLNVDVGGDLYPGLLDKSSKLMDVLYNDAEQYPDFYDVQIDGGASPSNSILLVPSTPSAAIKFEKAIVEVLNTQDMADL